MPGETPPPLLVRDLGDGAAIGTACVAANATLGDVASVVSGRDAIFPSPNPLLLLVVVTEIGLVLAGRRLLLVLNAVGLTLFFTPTFTPTVFITREGD
jgi:hypothetical protein